MPRLVLSESKRNDTYADWWSLTHVVFGTALALVLPGFWALAVMVLWEPFEILAVSPVMARFGVAFGHESLRNSLMDVVFDVVGVLLGVYVARPFLSVSLPFA